MRKPEPPTEQGAGMIDPTRSADRETTGAGKAGFASAI